MISAAFTEDFAHAEEAYRHEGVRTPARSHRRPVAWLRALLRHAQHTRTVAD